MRKLSAMFLALSTLAACKEVKIQDGRIPTDYITTAAAYMGTYTGKFNGKAAEVALWLEGDVVKVKYTDGRGKDILDPACESSVGLVETLNVSGSKENPVLDIANFNFNPGKCKDMVIGRKLHLIFEKNSSPLKMTAAILHSYDWTRCPYPGNCTSRDVEVYLLGVLNKRN